jgi:hypothetical protein
MNSIHVLTVMLVALLAGCATEHPYRTALGIPSASCREVYEDAQSGDPNRNLDERSMDQAERIRQDLNNPSRQSCWKTSWEDHADYELHFLEFDDQGWLNSANRSNPNAENQITSLLKRLYSLSNDSKEPLSIIIYTHGWHHTAEAFDGNVIAFRDLLQQASGLEKSLCLKNREQNGDNDREKKDGSPDICIDHELVSKEVKFYRRKRHVVGIYVGWRGDSITFPFLEYTSIWDRKLAAQKVALGSVQEFYALMHDYYLRHFCHSGHQASNARNCNDTADVRMLTIGHSFGGLITYRGLQSRMMSGVSETYRYNVANSSVPDAYGYGDLTVLINPAFEGTQFEPLAWAAMNRDYKSSQLPILIVAQSKGDWATHYAFPVFRFLTTPFEAKNGKEQYVNNWEAVGWSCRFKTHELSFEHADHSCGNPKDMVEELKMEEDWADKQRKSNYLEFRAPTLKLCDGLILKRSLGANALLKDPSEPLWVVQADTQVIKDHDDFLNPRLVDFVKQIYFTILQTGDENMTPSSAK